MQRRLPCMTWIHICILSIVAAGDYKDVQGEAILYPAAPDQRPGQAAAALENDGNAVMLQNGVLRIHWALKGSKLVPGTISNLLAATSWQLPVEAFAAQLDSGELRGSELVAETGFQLDRLSPEPGALQLGRGKPGWRAQLMLTGPEGKVRAHWSAELRDGAGYVRIQLKLLPTDSIPLSLQELVLFDGDLPESRVEGASHVPGVPVTAGALFLGYEHPQAQNSVIGQHVRCTLVQARKLGPDNSFRGSLVLGVAPHGQLRRAFWHYLERERAHPTRPMLHYNSWYDIGTGMQFSAHEAIERIDQIGHELGMRGVQLDAFLLDDGWDDPDAGPWRPHNGFSNKSLAALHQRAKYWSTHLGVWFSPFGGYHAPRQRRLRAARSVGLPVREEPQKPVKAVQKTAGACSSTNPCQEGEGDCDRNEDCTGNLECFQQDHGVGPPGVDTSAVSDPNADFCFDPGKQPAFLGLGLDEYYRHLLGAISQWLADGACLLKLDGVGNPGSRERTLPEDFDAAWSLIADLRRVSKRVFINLSTGTWPSPFWLLAADTVWRQGHDHYFAGQGPPRERWITYRDAMVFKHNVQVSPFLPLNSLMVHGIIFAKDAWDLNKPESVEEGMAKSAFRHEVRSAFASGTMLQELYITPSLLNRQNWDDLAAAARWVRPRMQVLADTHWVGGDPELGAVYGWAAWRDAEHSGNASEAVLTLRNPSPNSQTIHLEASSIFGLPAHAAGAVELNSPFVDQRPRRIVLWPGAAVSLDVAPFAVLVFDTSVPAPSRWEQRIDFFLDHLAQLFWSALAVAGCIAAWRHIAGGPAGPVPVPVEELRAKRLAALDRLAAGAPKQKAASAGTDADSELRRRGTAEG